MLGAGVCRGQSSNRGVRERSVGDFGGGQESAESQRKQEMLSRGVRERSVGYFSRGQQSCGGKRRKVKKKPKKKKHSEGEKKTQVTGKTQGVEQIVQVHPTDGYQTVTRPKRLSRQPISSATRSATRA